MPSWLKVLFIIGGLTVLLVVASVGVGLYFVNKYVPGLVESGKKAFGEGQEYGRRTDYEGCVAEAAARHGHSQDFTDKIKSGLFLRSCLEASRPTPGFCNTVPRQIDFLKGAQWQAEQCRKYDLKMENQCGQLFQQVQQFCEQRSSRSAGNSNAEEDSNTDGDETPPPPPPPAPAPRRLAPAH
jgi:hypothetical protein